MGTIRSVDSLALALLRLIGEEARKDRTVKVIAQLPVEVATYLMNEKRDWLNNIETKSGAQVVLVPNKYMETPAYEIRRVRDDETGLPENAVISHQLAVQPQIDLEAFAAEDKKTPPPTPAVTTVVPSTPAPPPAPEPVVQAVAPVIAAAIPQYGPRDGIFVRAWHWLFGDKRAPEPQPVEPRTDRVRDARPPRDSRDGHNPRRDRPRDHDSRRGGRDEHRRDAARGESRGGDRPQGGRNERRGERGEARHDHRRDGARRFEGSSSGGQGSSGNQGSAGNQRPPATGPVPTRDPLASGVTGNAPASAAGGSAPRRDENTGSDGVRTERTERTERPDGERGRRSRRGGRRRRRDHDGPGNGESRWSGSPSGDGASPPREPGATDGPPGSPPVERSFSPPSDGSSVTSVPPMVPREPPVEWTPPAQSDTGRSDPRGDT